MTTTHRLNANGSWLAELTVEDVIDPDGITVRSCIGILNRVYPYLDVDEWSVDDEKRVRAIEARIREWVLKLATEAQAAGKPMHITELNAGRLWHIGHFGPVSSNNRNSAVYPVRSFGMKR